MAANRGQYAKPKWHKAVFRLLLEGTWFKAFRSQESWWVKTGNDEASSPNGQVRQKWLPDDVVFIDLACCLNRSDIVAARDAR